MPGATQGFDAFQPCILFRDPFVFLLPDQATVLFRTKWELTEMTGTIIGANWLEGRWRNLVAAAAMAAGTASAEAPETLELDTVTVEPRQVRAALRLAF